MSKREVIAIGAAAVIVAIGVLAAFLGRDQASPPATTPQNNGEGPTPAEVTTPAPSGFTAEIPRGAVLSQPESELPAAPGAVEKLRVFSLTMNERGFSPQAVTVNRGDIVNITVTAEDGDYDFSMPYLGLYQAIPLGEQKKVSFGVNQSGTFTFECRDRCPASGAISGSLIVLP